MRIEQVIGKPVIGALKSTAELDQAIEHNLAAVVLLRGDVFDVIAVAERARAAGVAALIHVDLVEGIGRDAAGVRFLARNVGIAGVITTKAKLARVARDAGLVSILRLFLLDSQSYATGVELLRTANPDAVEILPGLILPHLADEVKRDIRRPVIAGGFIRTAAEARAVLAAGAVAVSTTSKELWSLRA